MRLQGQTMFSRNTRGWVADMDPKPIKHDSE